MQNEPVSIIGIVFTFILSLFSSCDLPSSSPVNPNAPTSFEMLFSIDAENVDDEDLETTVRVLEERLGSLVNEVVSIKGANTILLRLPASSADDNSQIVRLATQQGKLSFQIVKDNVTREDLSPEDLEASVFTEPIISEASIQLDSLGLNAIAFEVHPDYQDALGDLTQNNIGKRLAIVLDGDVLMAPIIQARISDRGIITGRETLAETQELAQLLNSDPLPFPLIFDIARY